MANLIVTNANDSGTGSLREAVEIAKSGDTIQVSSKLKNQTIKLTSGEIKFDNKDLTIDGSNASNLSISGNNNSRIFNIESKPPDLTSDVTIKNLTLTEGKSSGEGESAGGGAIHAQGRTILTVENVDFIDNEATSHGGGAIYARFRSDVTVSDSKFEGNTASGDTGRGGGAIAVASEGSLTVKDSEFLDNQGTQGGAINTLLSEFTIEGSTFTGNSTTKNGGAIFTDGASPGGPNGTETGTITIRDSQFEENQGVGAGGSLYLYTYRGDDILIEDSTISNNTVTKADSGLAMGGGIHTGGGSSEGSVTIRNSEISDNSSNTGGGIHYEGGKTLDIENSVLSGNETSSGGAIYSTSKSAIDINASTITDNVARDKDGAIFADRSDDITLTHSIVANNSSNNGRQTTIQLNDGGGNVEFPAPKSGEKVVKGSQVIDPSENPNIDAGATLDSEPEPSAKAPSSPPLIDSGSSGGSNSTGGNDDDAISETDSLRLKDVAGKDGPAITNPDAAESEKSASIADAKPETAMKASKGDVWYVDAKAGEAGDGTDNDPFSSIQAAVDVADAGDEIIVREGTYREAIDLKSSGTKEAPITLRAETGADVVVKGSRLVSDWSPVTTVGDSANKTYKASDWFAERVWEWDSRWTDSDPTNDEGDARTKAKNLLFVNGEYYEEVPSYSNSKPLEPGQFYIDRGAGGKSLHDVYVRLYDDSDPSNKIVEAASDRTLGELLHTQGQDHWNIEGIDFTQAANAQQHFGAVRISGAEDNKSESITVRDVNVSNVASAGISLSGSNHLVEHSTFNNNGQLGVHSAGAKDTIVRYSELANNNKLEGKNYSTGWEAGATKIVRSDGFVFDNMHVHDNYGSGLWFDVENRNATISNSVLHDNKHGIHYEISYTGKIYNNLIVNNDKQTKQASNTGIGIFVSAAGGNEIYNNTIWGNEKDGILIGEPRQGVRGDGGGNWVGPYSNNVYNNILANNQAEGNSNAYGLRRSVGKNNENTVFKNSKNPENKTVIELLQEKNPYYTFDPNKINSSDNNLFYQREGREKLGGGHKNLAEWQAADGGQYDANSIEADPLLLDPEAGDFRLADDSPAHSIQAGADVEVAAGDALVGRWTLDAITNGAVKNKSFRRGDDGAVVNAKLTEGAAGKALRFNGNAHVELPSNSETPLINSEKGSVSLWFRTDHDQAAPAMLFYADDSATGSSAKNELSLSLTDDNALQFQIEGGSQAVEITSTAAYNDGQWHHATATWDIDGEAQLYINGDLIGAQTHDANRFQSEQPVRLGAANKAGQAAFTGDLDEVLIYDRPLENFEVWSLHEEPVSSSPFELPSLPKSAPEPAPRPAPQPVEPADGKLVSWLNFDAVEDSTATDSAPGNDNPATLVGGITTTQGIKGKAIALKGQGQYAAIANTPEINLGVHKQRTVSLWFRADETATETRKQVLYEEGGSQRGLNAYLHEGELYVGGWNEPAKESSWDGTWLSTDKVSANQWHHVALVLNGSDSVSPNAITAYLDGEQFGQGEGSQLWQHPGKIGLGSINGATQFHDGTEPGKGHGLVGALDEVKIFNSALDTGQVQSLAA